MWEIKECKLFLRCKAMLILTQLQDLIPQVQLLASVQTFEILVLSASCTENDSPCSEDPSVAFGFGEELQDQ
jgi:hypothetical protein